MKALTRKGNVLLAALLAMAILTMLVAGAIVFTGQNQRAAVSKVSSDEVRACGELARRYLLSRLKVFGLGAASPKQMTLVQTVTDNVTAAKRSTISTKHYDGTNAPTGATIPNDAIGGSKDNTRDITNVIVGEDVGGAYYSVVVMCDQPGGRASEVEFVFKFGI